VREICHIFIKTGCQDSWKTADCQRIYEITEADHQWLIRKYGEENKHGEGKPKTLVAAQVLLAFAALGLASFLAVMSYGIWMIFLSAT
jgi:hypothetical protein